MLSLVPLPVAVRRIDAGGQVEKKPAVLPEPEEVMAAVMVAEPG